MLDEPLSKKSPDVGELIEQINKYRRVDNAKHLDLACDLFDLAQECGNDDLRDFASCTLGDACCQNRDFSQALYYLSAGVTGLAKTDEYDLICSSYNELGIILRSEGHFITSEEYFINCIEMARAHRLYFNESIACANFAALCAEMEAFDRALEYHFRAIECCNFIENPELKNELAVGSYAFILKIYSRMKDAERADNAFNSMSDILNNYPEFDELFDISIAKLIYYRFKKNRNGVQELKERCLKSFYECEEYIINFDEVQDLIHFLFATKDFEELKKVFRQIKTVSKDDDFTNLMLFVASYKIKMYEALGDEKGLKDALLSYHIYNEKKAEDSKRSFLTTLRLRSELAQQRTKNLFLSAAAETDSLTGIANRLKLNTVIDELFILANDEGKNLGVEMMDIDFFKQVNDTYGHAKGDELLKALAQVLKSIVNEKIFVARYGGDEFIIYYYDMEDAEILDVARHIQKSMDKVSADLGLDCITVSQGIVNHVPRQLNRAWDYMNAADLALYFVKNHGKANARLVHRATELENLAWEKVF